MMKTISLALLAVGIAGANLAYGQRDTRTYENNRATNGQNRYENRPYTENQSLRSNGISTQQFERALINAYKEGYKDGMETGQKLKRNATPDRVTTRDRRIYPDPDRVRTNETMGRNNDNRSASPRLNTRDRRNDETMQTSEVNVNERRVIVKEKQVLPYKAFTGGFYGGLNTTRYLGEDIDASNLSGRLGYQLGVFTRFGGRVYGQLGAEYFASSSNFFVPGDGQSIQDISGRINNRWLQIPALVGVKLAQSTRGISGIRLAVGAEYANRLGGSNTVQINNESFRRGSFLALGNLGFDLGPVMLDLVYHHGLNDLISGFNNSQRRSFGVNVGFKF
ncbi:hypothetical protein GCM10023189_23800 [Nibrella saemangeumensis]|uniref:Outer membrane protein beta-barrel domain-containing protein n=1 Tax=Nibrella saemangeumensis TaxID=1084526 RepID=A0ABP8MTH0_9BACT